MIWQWTLARRTYKYINLWVVCWSMTNGWLSPEHWSRSAVSADCSSNEMSVGNDTLSRECKTNSKMKYKNWGQRVNENVRNECHIKGAHNVNLTESILISIALEMQLPVQAQLLRALASRYRNWVWCNWLLLEDVSQDDLIITTLLRGTYY